MLNGPLTGTGSYTRRLLLPYYIIIVKLIALFTLTIDHPDPLCQVQDHLDPPVMMTVVGIEKLVAIVAVGNSGAVAVVIVGALVVNCFLKLLAVIAVIVVVFAVFVPENTDISLDGRRLH